MATNRFEFKLKPIKEENLIVTLSRQVNDKIWDGAKLGKYPDKDLDALTSAISNLLL